MVTDATYPIGKESIADSDSRARSLGDAEPAVRFLRDRTVCIVVPVKGCERGQLHPAIAQFLVGVTI